MLGSRHLDLLAVLDEVLRDAVEIGTRAVELGDDGELLAGVDGLALAVEVGVSMAEAWTVLEPVYGRGKNFDSASVT